MLLADTRPAVAGSSSADVDGVDAALRMARLYYDRYSWVLDWSNIHGKTALHIASSKGIEELVRVRTPAFWWLYHTHMPHQMLCDLGADFDLSDNKGNTPLH
jgi:uncharacterized protein